MENNDCVWWYESYILRWKGIWQKVTPQNKLLKWEDIQFRAKRLDDIGVERETLSTHAPAQGTFCNRHGNALMQWCTFVMLHLSFEPPPSTAADMWRQSDSDFRLAQVRNLLQKGGSLVDTVCNTDHLYQRKKFWWSWANTTQMIVAECCHMLCTKDMIDRTNKM